MYLCSRRPSRRDRPIRSLWPRRGAPHIQNYDIRLMTVIAALVGAVALLSDWAGRIRIEGRSRDGDREKGGLADLVLFVVWILALILAPLVSQLLAMAVSRRREY